MYEDICYHSKRDAFPSSWWCWNIGWFLFSFCIGELSCCLYLSVPTHLESFLLWREQSRPLCEMKATWIWSKGNGKNSQWSMIKIKFVHLGRIVIMACTQKVWKVELCNRLPGKFFSVPFSVSQAWLLVLLFYAASRQSKATAAEMDGGGINVSSASCRTGGLGGKEQKHLPFSHTVPSNFTFLCVFQGRKDKCSRERGFSAHRRHHAQKHAYSEGSWRMWITKCWGCWFLSSCCQRWLFNIQES